MFMSLGGAPTQTDEAMAKAFSYLEQMAMLDPSDHEERFYLVSKAISELDSVLWYILEDARYEGCTIPMSDIDNAEARVQPEIAQVESQSVSTGIDRVIQIGTIKAKLNTILRLSVTNRK
jgi:hypothetical protein